MNVLFALIPLGLVLLVAAVLAFFWAVRSGQFDDLETPGVLVLFDEEPPTRTPGEAQPGAAPHRTQSPDLRASLQADVR